MNDSARRIRVLLVDDHALFRAGVAEIFAAEDDLEVVGEAGSGEQAVALAEKEKPDVVLLDVEMPSMDAEEALRRILLASPSSKVIVLTMHDEVYFVRKLLRSGARAYVLKNAMREELITIVRTVHRVEDRVILSVSRGTLERLEGREESPVSDRELEVLSLAAEGLSNAQIASRLYISEGTIKRHLTSVYAKLGVVSRMDAINKATAAGLMTVTRIS